MFTGTIDTGERFLVQKTGQLVPAGNLLHCFHNQLVGVGCYVGGVKDSCKLELTGRNFVVLCLCGNTELPEFKVEFPHEVGKPASLMEPK